MKIKRINSVCFEFSQLAVDVALGYATHTTHTEKKSTRFLFIIVGAIKIYFLNISCKNGKVNAPENVVSSTRCTRNEIVRLTFLENLYENYPLLCVLDTQNVGHLVIFGLETIDRLMSQTKKSLK